MPVKLLRSYHVGVAAEAFAAGMFAQSGCDVLVQYGANQPEYDLVITRGKSVRHVSVKGSQDSGWGLIQNYKSNEREYHEAADAWAANHKPRDLIYCFVQFADVSLGQCPRVYLATIDEVLLRHKESRNWDQRFFTKIAVTRRARQKAALIESRTLGGSPINASTIFSPSSNTR
jgi:Holliday junction resolvase-like predicted endonuclease